MSWFLSLLDVSAHARGGGHYSNVHVSGGELLAGFAFLLLVVVLYQAAKLSLANASVLVNLAVFCGIGGLLVACLFMGPVAVLLGIAFALYLAYQAHERWVRRKSAQR